jgi:hypothetical protein
MRQLVIWRDKMSKMNPLNKVFRDTLQKHMPEIMRGIRGQWNYKPEDVLDYKFLHLYSTIKATGLQINVNGKPEIAMSYDKAFEYANLKEFNVNYGGNHMMKVWGLAVEIPGFPYVKAFITYSASDNTENKEKYFFLYEFSTGMKLYWQGSNSSQEAIRLAAKNIGSYIKNEKEFRIFVDSAISMYGVKNE